GVRRWWQVVRGWQSGSWFRSSYDVRAIVRDASNQPIAGAEVRIRNGSNQIVASGITNEDGSFSSPVDYFRMDTTADGGAKTSYGNYFISASLGGATSETVNIAQGESVEVQLVLP